MAVLQSVIELIRALGLTSVAEGVEDDETLRVLGQAGCDVAQGYWIARPMPAAQTGPWLAQRQARSRTLRWWPAPGPQPPPRRDSQPT